MARLVEPFMTYNDDNGDPLSGGLLQFNVSGSASLAKDTFSDALLTTANPNPIVLDSAGRVPDTVVDVFGDGDYRLIVKTSAGVAQETFDPLSGSSVFTTASYASLKAIGDAQVAEGQAIYVKGRASINDGGEGWFFATLSSPGADNDVTILHSTSGNVFYVRETATSIHIGAAGGVGDDSTDNAAAFVKALNLELPVELDHDGIYLISSPLTGLTTKRYKMFSQESQRGTNSANVRSTYPSATIKYRPSTATDYMVAVSGAGVVDHIGPFEHDGIFLDLAGNNGFEFGDPSFDPITDGANQSYVFAVTFKNGAINGDNADRSSTAGVITRSGQVMVSMTKCFEAVFDNFSMNGSDIQIKTNGCDKPTFKQFRSARSHVPLLMEGSGTFTAQHTVDGFQAEGWTFGGVVANEVDVAMDNYRLEQNDGSPTGSGRYDMTAALSFTEAVVAGSDTLTFSSAMDNILFPGLSIIELEDTSTGEIDTVLVATVSGTTVTYDDTQTHIRWSDTVANVTRIHGYCVLHNSKFDGNYSNGSVSQSSAVPPFVYVANRGGMYIHGAAQQAGGGTQAQSLVIGNRLNAASFLNSAMTFSGCSPNVMADPSHPLVHVVDWQEGQGGSGYIAGLRTPFGDAFEQMNRTNKKWALTPKTTGLSSNVSHTTPFIKEAGDAGTSQQEWGWYIVAGSTVPLLLENRTLPSGASAWVKIRIRAKTLSGTATLSWGYVGSGSGTTPTVALTTTLKTFEFIVPVPAAWQGVADTGSRGFQINDDASVDLFIGAVTIEEAEPGQWVQHPTDHTGITASASITWDDIPDWATAIKIAYADFSSTATQELFLRIGDASSVEATGYSGRTAATAGADDWSTEAPATNGLTASDVANGQITLEKTPGGNQWIINLTSVPETSGSLVVGAGVKTLTGILTRVQLLVGTGTIDAGDFVLYFK